MENENHLKWDNWYILAKEYYDKNKTLLIPHNYETENGYKLGTWINRQRLSYKNEKPTKLTNEQIEKLNNIEMIWNSHEEKWNKNYKEANAYFMENNNLNVPNNYVSPNGVKLSSWLSVQRKNYKDNHLTQSQITQLENIEMRWNLADNQWIKMYEIAKKYYKQFGSLAVPVSYITDDGVKLNNWIRRQRDSYHGINGKLTKEKIQLLNEIEMKWNVSSEKKWNDNYDEAKMYFLKHKNLLILNNYITESGLSLGKWIDIQRKRYTMGDLPESRIEKLNSIHMLWDSNNISKWDRNYLIAKNYYEDNGHLNITQRYVSKEGIKLGLWILNQKDKKNKKTLEENKIKKLEDIGITWSDK